MTISVPEIYAASINSQDSLLYISGHFYLYCYDAVSGALLWQVGLGVAGGYAWPNLDGVTALNNQIFYNYDYLYARDARTSQIIWKTYLETYDGWSYSVPCVVTKGGKVYRYGNNF